jgi:hypothetical protein
MEQNMEDPQNSIYRYERKFFIYNMDCISVQNIVLNHPAFFSEIYFARDINNIYFDFLRFNNLMDNIDGNMFRTKYRIRWYGNMLSEIEKPTLELKIKKGLIGTKKHFQLNQFELLKGINISKLKNVVKDSQIDSQTKFFIQEQTPVMLNRYKRKYFESNNKKFRITIDYEQSFYKLNAFNNTFLHVHKDPCNIILELKYDKKYESEACQITNKLPFRLTKSSKYARGILLLYS